MTELLAIFRCCRDWPVSPLARIGRCGFCHERPTFTDKSLAVYMAEREAERTGVKL